MSIKKVIFGLLALIMAHSANAQTGKIIQVKTIDEAIEKLESMRNGGGDNQWTTQSQLFNIEVIPTQQFLEVLNETNNGEIQPGMVSPDNWNDFITINIPFCLNLTIGCEED